MNKILQGNSIDMLRTLPDESVNCCITSPPYWSLRDYGTAEWEGGDTKCNHVYDKSMPGPGSTVGNASHKKYHHPFKDVCGKCGAKRVDNQLGLEPTFKEYINKLCDVFDEVKRVLKKDGTCWVVIGDTYAAGGGLAVQKSMKRQSAINTGAYPDHSPNSKLRTTMGKCLLQIPSRFAIEMTDRGWILRNELIWHKPNCMPSSAKDRFTVDFEKIFFFTKNKKYYFKQQLESLHAPDVTHRTAKGGDGSGELGTSVRFGNSQEGRNKRTTWTINTEPNPDAHFAVFPKKIPATCIEAGCPEGGVVLDPFCGSGTTLKVAKDMGRKYIGIDLNPEYVKMAENNLRQEVLSFTG